MNDPKAPIEPWRSAIATADQTNIWLRGYDMATLMERGSFAETVYLLHQGRLPTAAERKLVDAMLIASSDHGAGAPSCASARLIASGNRQSFSAAVAGGILAIGDEHGGAGSICVELIVEAAERAKRDTLPIEKVAEAFVERAIKQKRRLPGLGHRVHTIDPRVDVLFGMAQESGLAGDGVKFIRALGTTASQRIKPLPINIDGAIAAVLYDLGFPPAAGKYIFIIGRVAGITAEIAEEYTREKPMRIRIPVKYDGVPPRKAPRAER